MAPSISSNGVPAIYYEEPFTLEDMDDEIYGGLLAIGTLATISVVFAGVLLSFITWRMIRVRSPFS